MLQRLLTAFLFLAAAALPAGAAEAEVPASPIKIAVLDFATIDTIAQKLYPRAGERAPAKPDSQLNDDDYGAIDDLALGLLRSLEVQSSLREKSEARERQTRQEDRELARRDELTSKILNSPRRVIVIGADYMTAALAAYPRLFSPLGRPVMEDALRKLGDGQRQEEAWLRLAKASGASHALYAVVPDCRTAETAFHGYGVETKKCVRELDVVVSLMDLDSGRVVFGGVFTGRDTQLIHGASSRSDDGLYAKMMRDAVGQAAAAMAERFGERKTK